MRALFPFIALVATSNVAFAQEGEAPPASTEPAASTTMDEQPAPTPVVETTAVPEPVAAYESSSGPALPEFHGYATQGFIISDHNNYYQSRSNRGSARLTEVALNISDALTDRLRIVVQMSSTLSDEYPDVQLRLDFGFADYRIADELGVRVGRFRSLGGLYAEVWDTDIARTPIFLPSAVYNPSGRNFALAANGIQLYGRAALGGAGGLNYAASIGALQAITVGTISADVSMVATGRVIYETPIEGLRLGGAVTVVQFDTHIDIGADAAAGLVAAGIAPAGYTGAAVITAKGKDAFVQPYAFLEYASGNLTLAAEYTRNTATRVVREDFLRGIIPNGKIQSDGFYVLGSYRFNDLFTLGSYGSFSWENYHDRSTDPALHTFDYALTTRFDLNSFAAFKLEGHYIDGMSHLNPTLNTGTKVDTGWLFAARLSAAF